jgi:CMP-N-acetylneuraminic acid synthetase
LFAYIPARIGSKRIIEKNIRHLDNKPVICHVIENLSKIKGLKGIAISTDSEEILDLVACFPNVITLGLREKKVATDKATFMDLVRQDLPRFQAYFSSDNVLFTLATSALISVNYFQDAVNVFNIHKNGLVMSVKGLGLEASLALKLQEDSSVSPIFPENYALPTVKLPKLFSDAGGFYLFNVKQLMKYNMFIELKPIIPIVLPNDIGIDIDNESDWDRLEAAYFSLKAKGLGL